MVRHPDTPREIDAVNGSDIAHGVAGQLILCIVVGAILLSVFGWGAFFGFLWLINHVHFA